MQDLWIVFIHDLGPYVLALQLLLYVKIMVIKVVMSWFRWEKVEFPYYEKLFCAHSI